MWFSALTLELNWLEAAHENDRPAEIFTQLFLHRTQQNMRNNDVAPLVAMHVQFVKDLENEGI